MSTLMQPDARRNALAHPISSGPLPGISSFALRVPGMHASRSDLLQNLKRCSYLDCTLYLTLRALERPLKSQMDRGFVEESIDDVDKLIDSTANTTGSLSETR